MSATPRDLNKIRTERRYIGIFPYVEYSKPLEEYISTFRERVMDVLKRYSHLEPMDIYIDTDTDEGCIEHTVYASLMESDEDYAYRMQAIAHEDEIEAKAIENIRLREEANRLADEAFFKKLEEDKLGLKVANELVKDDEFLEYKRLRDKFKTYETYEQMGLMK